VISFPPFRLDPANEQLWRGRHLVALKPKTFAVLRYLLERPQRLVTKDDLLDALWAGVHVGEAVLKTHLREIRQALGDNVKAPRFIETVHRRGYRFIAAVHHAPAKSSPRLLTSLTSSFVGRQVELARLHESLERALGGQRQVVLVTGEPGIGKTTLVKAFLDQLQDQGDLWLTWGQCIEPYGAGEAYLPVLEALGRLGRGLGGERIVEVLIRQAPSWLAQMPGLLTAAEWATLRRQAAGAMPERMLREMAEALEALSRERLLVLWFEDLHWADYSTLDLISYLARRSGPARLLLLGTYRPVEVQVGEHPLAAVEEDLLLHGQGHGLSLAYLVEPAVSEYLADRCPWHRFPPGLATLIHQRTDGNPLFMVNVVESLVERGTVRQVDGRWRLTVALDEVGVGVPENVVRMIDREIDRLDPLERRVIEAASVAGLEFSTAAVAAAVEEDLIRVEEVCTRLSRRGQFLQLKDHTHWPDGTVAVRCGFIHGLYQEVAYERIGVARQARWHQRIGEREEAGYGDRASVIATELAVHFERGRDYPRAVRYLRSAGEKAVLQSAYREAIAHLTRALALLQKLPGTPEVLAETIETRIALSPALIALKGAGSAEVEDSYLNARELVDRLGDESRRFPVLWGLWFVNYSRGRYGAAREAGQRLLEVAHRGDSGEQLLEAHHALWPTLSAMGQPAAAILHIEQGLALYDRDRPASPPFLYGGHDPGVCCHYYLALTRWLLGYPDRAVLALHDALRLVEAQAHPLTTVNALWFSAWVHYQRGERDMAAATAHRAIVMSTEHGFTGWPDAALSLTRIGSEQRPDTQALAELHRRLVSAWTGGAIWRQAFCLCALAEIHAEGERVEEALGALASIPAEARGAFYAPEIHRIEGELALLRLPPLTDDAERHFRTAIDLARGRAEKSLELRAATSLARFWRGQGKHEDARSLLAGVYEWFTEGLVTADLRAARRLLEDIP
jgi:DNA-binding winged helix-turn-helix (wHTH) protein/tetratricopeptide (TPR) repeat protein